jgi:hypothetical protein
MLNAMSTYGITPATLRQRHFLRAQIDALESLFPTAYNSVIVPLQQFAGLPPDPYTALTAAGYVFYTSVCIANNHPQQVLKAQVLVQDTVVTSNFDVSGFSGQLLGGLLVPPNFFTSKKKSFKSDFETLEAILFETAKAKFLFFSLTSQDATLWPCLQHQDCFSSLLHAFLTQANISLQFSSASQPTVDNCHLGAAMELPLAFMIRILNQLDPHSECVLAFTVPLKSLEQFPSLKAFLLQAGTLPT